MGVLDWMNTDNLDWLNTDQNTVTDADPTTPSTDVVTDPIATTDPNAGQTQDPVTAPPSTVQPPQSFEVVTYPSALELAGAPNSAFTPMDTNSLVSTRLQEILSQDSPLLEQARQRGIATAHRRGFNPGSSIAAGAAEREMINAGLSIASQDAQQMYDWNKADKAFQHSWDLMQGEFANRITELERNIGGNLQLQELRNLGSQDLETLRQRATEMSLNESMSRAYLSSMAGLQAMMLKEITTVQQMQGLTEEQKQEALTEIETRFGDGYAFMDEIYNQSHSWNWDFL